MTVYRTALAKQLDTYTDSMMSIDRLITTIFEGRMYNVSNSFTLGDGSSMEFLIETGGQNTHTWFQVWGSLNFDVSLYEDTTKVQNSSNLLTVTNRNRTSANTADVVVSHTPTGTGNGTLLYSNSFGSASGPIRGGSTGEQQQWVLKPNSKYLAIVTSGGTGNDIGVSADLVEFTSENNEYEAIAYSNLDD